MGVDPVNPIKAWAAQIRAPFLLLSVVLVLIGGAGVAIGFLTDFGFFHRAQNIIFKEIGNNLRLISRATCLDRKYH